jgi:hypothetical protein
MNRLERLCIGRGELRVRTQMAVLVMFATRLLIPKL